MAENSGLRIRERVVLNVEILVARSKLNLRTLKTVLCFRFHDKSGKSTPRGSFGPHSNAEHNLLEAGKWINLFYDFFF